MFLLMTNEKIYRSLDVTVWPFQDTHRIELYTKSNISETTYSLFKKIYIILHKDVSFFMCSILL